MASGEADIGEWLRAIDLAGLTAVFQANGIDLDVLAELTEGDLREIGLSLGQRRKLMRAIRTRAAEAGSAIADAASMAAPEAERRQLTVLFCDVVGSTEMVRRLDPEEMLDLRNAYHAFCRQVVGRYGGRVTQYLGDGVVAFFGFPFASEHDALAAVRAGLALAGRSESVRTPYDEGLRVRVGIATGLTVVLDPEDTPDAVGGPMNLAARLEAEAEPGSVVISGDTHRLVWLRFDCEDLGALPLKGFEVPMPVWRVNGEIVAETAFAARHERPASPLVGRGAELDVLRSHWKRTRGGAGSVLCLQGEAGLGKSRLSGEFLAEVGDAALVLKFFGTAGAGQTPFRPIVEQVAWSAGFTAGEPADARLDKLEAMLSRLGLDAARLAPVYAELCGVPTRGRYRPLELSPLRLKRTIFDAMLEAVAHLALRQPVLILFEDLHWMDPTTLELAADLARAVESWPVMLLMTSRPVGMPLWPETQPVHVIPLGRLSPGEAERLLRTEIERAGADPELAGRILARADGVPLYIEELTRAAGAAEAGDGPGIPTTLQDALTARLDRLGAAKSVAQKAAVIGRDFRPSLLAAVAEVDVGALETVLVRLVEEGVLVRSNERVGSETLYRFRHALLRDAAYSSQLRRTRRTRHAAVAAVLQRDFPEVVAESPGELAHHLAAAGAAREAAEAWRRAGLLALQGAHYREAVEAYGSALEQLAEAGGDPGFELEMLTERGTAQIALMGFAAAEVGETYGRAEALGRELGTGAALARALWGLWLYHLVKGNLAHARRLAEELADLARDLGDDGLLLEARWALGDTLFWLGDLAAAQDALESALVLHDPDLHGEHALLFGQDPQVAALCYLAYTCWARGDDAAVQVAMRTALRRARALNHPFTTGWALSFAGLISAWRDEPRATLRLSGMALQHTEEQIMPFWQSAMTIVHGWARLRLGEVEAGLAEAEAGLAFYDMIGSETVQPYFRGLLADCLGRAGRHDDAAAMLASAFEKARRSGERISEMRLHVVDARLEHARTGRPATAALDTTERMAREAGAVGVELEAALERAAQLAGSRPAEARRRLGATLARIPDAARSGLGRRALKLLETMGED